jgi:predicted metal-dependent hydrolase
MPDIPYKIIRTDRKNIALIIDSGANLIVRAPHSARKSEIVEFIEVKKRWIAAKQRQITAFTKKHNPVVIGNGKSLLYQGDTYTMRAGNVRKIQLSGNEIFLPPKCTKEKLIAWLKREARKLFHERADRYADIMGVHYSSIKLSGAKTRWGSCSKKDNLNFTWRLVMCPIAVIDYVVVHELSHITIKNHSPAFWARVRTFIPNYRELRNWLKSNRTLLEIL